MKRFSIVFLVLLFALSGCGGNAPESTQESTSESEVESSDLEESSNTLWAPEGFSVIPSNPNVAIRFPGQKCDDYTCIDIEFVTLTGCSYFYAAVNALTEENGSVIGYDNTSLPSLRPLQVAKLRFEDTSNTAGYMEIAEVVCN